MDFKKFGYVVMFLGIIILAFGGYVWVSNQADVYQRPSSAKGIMGGLNALESMMVIQDKNRERAKTRENAMKIMAGGVVVLFLGFGISISAKING